MLYSAAMLGRWWRRRRSAEDEPDDADEDEGDVDADAGDEDADGDRKPKATKPGVPEVRGSGGRGKNRAPLILDLLPDPR